MNLYAALALIVLVVHLAWILWVVLGWLLTRHRPWLRWFHIGSLVYGILLELFVWVCPLTHAEQWLLRRAGLRSYRDSFLGYYLEELIYPDVPLTLLIAVSLSVILLVLGVYLYRFRHRTPAGW